MTTGRSPKIRSSLRDGHVKMQEQSMPSFVYAKLKQKKEHMHFVNLLHSYSHISLYSLPHSSSNCIGSAFGSEATPCAAIPMSPPVIRSQPRMCGRANCT